MLIQFDVPNNQSSLKFGIPGKWYSNLECSFLRPSKWSEIGVLGTPKRSEIWLLGTPAFSEVGCLGTSKLSEISKLKKIKKIIIGLCNTAIFL